MHKSRESIDKQQAALLGYGKKPATKKPAVKKPKDGKAKN